MQVYIKQGKAFMQANNERPFIEQVFSIVMDFNPKPINFKK
jgi:hypothetical protein